MRGITLYSAKSGLEVMANDITKKGFKFGAVTLRFFKLENGGTPIKFIMSPVEAFSTSLMVAKVFSNQEPIKLKKTHKFEVDGKEVETTLYLEKWAKNGKSGFAISIQRDNTSINVPLDGSTFSYLGELLRYLSTQQAWINPVEQADEQDTADSATEPEPEDVANTGDDEVNDDFFKDVEEPEAPASAPPAQTSSNGNNLVGTIEVVRKDKKGFKLEDGGWFTVNDGTKLTTALKRGEKVRVEYREANNIKFANIVSPI